MSSTTPFYVRAAPGSNPTRHSGTTHEAVIALFEAAMPSHFFLSQQIGGKAPLSWLKDVREKCNYKEARFCEPEARDCFRAIKRAGVRRAIGAYVATGGDIYVFDDAHAILPYPLRCIQLAGRAIAGSGAKLTLENSDKSFVKRRCRDRDGAMPSLLGLLGEVIDWQR